MYDHRMQQKACFTFEMDSSQRLFRANSISKSPLKNPSNNYQLDSPKPSQNYFNDLRETGILPQIQEEPDSVLQAPEQFENEKFGARYIDIKDNSILSTFQNGFIQFDIRKPEKQQLSHLDDNMNTMKALFSPNSENVISADFNTRQLKLWDLKSNNCLLERELEHNVQDFIVSHVTGEVLTMEYQDQQSVINIYRAERIKLIDQIVSGQFQLHKIILSVNSSQLYGLGNYSLRTWKYYNSEEVELLTKKLDQFMIQKRNKLK